MSELEAGNWPLGYRDIPREEARGTAHIPEDVERRMIERGVNPQTVHYAGPLAVNSGFECEVRPVTPEEIERFGLPTERPKPEDIFKQIRSRRRSRRQA